MTSSLTTFLRAPQLSRRQRIVVLFVLLCVAISRAPYVLFHGRFFAEEGSIYFSHMKAGSVWFIARPVGYIYAFCNLATWLAARVPLQRAPLVTAWLSLGVIATVVWAALSWPSELFPDVRTRIAAAVLLIVGPLAVPAVWLNATNVQVYLGILAVLVLFVDVNALGRNGFVGIALLLGLAGLSGLYAATLAPLYLFRAFRERTHRMKVLAGVISLCALAQLIVVARSHASGNLAQGRGSFRGLGVMTRDVAAGHLSTFLFGGPVATRLSAHAYSFFGLLAFASFGLVLAAVLAFVLASTPRRRTAVLLAGAFVLSEILVLFGTRGSTGGRYLVVPVAILLLIAVYGISARNRVASGIASVICIVALVAGGSTFWTGQPTTLRCIKCPQWSQQVRSWQANHARRLVIWPYRAKQPWVVRLSEAQTGQSLRRG
ncbi:MAG TPA: hypothetical protein VL769_13955 [Acidimicrobiia bacterium]|nr:hypothetical protein [Acidimicrobiia bacterium]